MRTILCAVLAALVAAPVLGEDKPAVKELDTKDLKVAFPEKVPGIKNPEVVTIADALAKSPTLKDAADAVKKLVNFEKEKLVVFAWQGSGGDKLSAVAKTVDGKTTVTFLRTLGFTRDLRQHLKVYVVPKDADVKGGDAK
ncbi:MAG: DUF4443 domain-containing protein [Planctomycetes bacterium]|nr:DUF4443 domain-containing protein [Planctomycetota bacterium]